MESLLLKSLLTPWRKITSCVTGPKRHACTHQWARGRIPRGRDPAKLREYQAELERARKQHKERNAQKNAQRAEMRAHFRRKYKLPQNAEDSRRVRAEGGKLDLPHNLTRMVRSESLERGRRSGFLDLIQKLSISTGLYTHNTTHSRWSKRGVSGHVTPEHRNHGSTATSP